MTSKKPLSGFLLFTSIILLLSQTSVFAQGGFPDRPGRLLISPSVSYFYANTRWDSLGVKKPFDNNGKFHSIGVNLFVEYGISRRFAIVANLPYVYNEFTQDKFPSANTSGLGDLETGLKYYVANIDFVYYFSVQGTAITPLYTHNPNLGYGEEGAELRLAFSGTGHLGNSNTYFSLSDGVRQYFGTNGPIQNRYSGTFGVTLDKDFLNQVSVTVSGINSFSDDKSFAAIPETNKEFSFLQASLSYGHSFSHEFSIFATAGRFLTGRNTAIGNTLSLAFIYRLDYR
jgi:hypothetical protein